MAMEHWWRIDNYQGWHYYTDYDGLVIDEVVHRARFLVAYENSIVVISDTEFYVYVFAPVDKDLLHNVCHFKRCIDP